MKNAMKKIMIVGLSIVSVASSLVPAAAAPVPQAPKAVTQDIQTKSGSVVDVQYYGRRGEWRRGPPRHWRGDGPRYGRGWYRGHRGYRDYRPGYRRYNGYWFPLGAFATGAIIGGALNNQARPAYGGSHHEWCANRWRSYRAYDNSYQPYNGPRRACVSPYMR